MGIRSAEEIEGFARKILIRYFCEADVEFLISTFADDIVWLGAGEGSRGRMLPGRTG